MQKPFDEFARRLLSHGVPASDVARHVEELCGHREDLIAELREAHTDPDAAERHADERLGSMDTLAENAIMAHQRRFRMGRRKWLYFGVVPALAMPVVTIGMPVLLILIIVGLTQLMGHKEGDMPRAFWIGAKVYCYGMLYVWPGLMAAMVYRAAWRRGLGWFWRLFSTAEIVLWGAWFQFDLRLGDAVHRNNFTMGTHKLPQLGQMAASVAFVGLFAWLIQRRMHSRMPIS